MNITEALESVDLDEIIDSLNAYAISRLKQVGLKTFNGKEPIDFVGDLLLKAIEGKRDWSKAQCSFKEFLFGCLKSDISNFLNSIKNNFGDETELFDLSSKDYALNNMEQRKQVSELLSDEGSNDDELIVFDCWMDGILKPSEIAKELGIEVKEVYNITKRLERRLPKIRSQVNNIL